ncbi:hypothetical protein NQ314_002421 [Rhamnusium bicolor]|uniref:Uncharacterized protein n=1 Tax=Rhamnusium bicolor TaxID=1586634 RepID=A0AAV8ZRZ5_9CUCU|nr:hypothetical protein NQ314_002421 [Rhamnusium bicolor]
MDWRNLLVAKLILIPNHITLLTFAYKMLHNELCIQWRSDGIARLCNAQGPKHAGGHVKDPYLIKNEM